MTADGTNVVARLAELARIGRHDAGISRGLATPPERAARELFAAWARADNYALTQDRVGNLFARRRGARADAAPLLVGSHLDTVPTGGAYDGAYGVVAALCALELLDARGLTTQRPIEAVAWAGEEGSRFPLGCLGSSVFAGIVAEREALALVDDAGTSLGAALASPAGGLLDAIEPRRDRRVAAYVELHVEQGPVLERAGVALGIVTAIAGQRRYRAVVDGTSGHAGTVPMDGRSDALCAASELILALEAAAARSGECVVTVGRIAVEPNGTNVIPGRAIFSIDARSPDDARLDAIEDALDAAAFDARRRRSVRIATQRLEARAPTPMNPALRRVLRHAAERFEPQALDVTSGAGHDAIALAQIAPAAMLFVPSIGGRSHVDAERTDDADLEMGVEALAAALVEVDAALAAN